MNAEQETTVMLMLGASGDQLPQVRALYDDVKFRLDKVQAGPLTTEMLALLVALAVKRQPGEVPKPEPVIDDSMNIERACIVIDGGVEREGWYLGWAREDKHKVKFADDDKAYRLIPSHQFVTSLESLTA